MIQYFPATTGKAYNLFYPVEYRNDGWMSIGKSTHLTCFHLRPCENGAPTITVTVYEWQWNSTGGDWIHVPGRHGFWTPKTVEEARGMWNDLRSQGWGYDRQKG